ncbi:MAG: hypothetical protein M0C28_23365 [Candidatus Moduliflexus flocculans]|nr:hypothetical protein [Candidatus Moduliflexus flocculans]
MLASPAFSSASISAIFRQTPPLFPPLPAQNDQSTEDSFVPFRTRRGAGRQRILPRLEGTDALFYGSTTGSDIGIGPLAESYVADSWHELDVTVSAEDELAHYHNGRLQFRIYHNIGNDNDGVNDTDADPGQ